jgi:hypothetical protein
MQQRIPTKQATKKNTTTKKPGSAWEGGVPFTPFTTIIGVVNGLRGGGFFTLAAGEKAVVAFGSSHKHPAPFWFGTSFGECGMGTDTWGLFDKKNKKLKKRVFDKTKLN